MLCCLNGKTLVYSDLFLYSQLFQVNNLIFDSFLEKKLYCIYVAIGQKRSTVAQIMKRLENAGNLTQD